MRLSIFFMGRQAKNRQARIWTRRGREKDGDVERERQREKMREIG